MHISHCRQFFDIHISQGSVATYLRCGGIFKCVLLQNLPLSLSSKKHFENQLTCGEVMDKSLVSCFLTHSVDAGQSSSSTLARPTTPLAACDGNQKNW